MATSIKLKDAPGYFASMGAVMHKAARKGLLLAAERGVQKIVTEIIPSRSPAPVDRGVYRAGWKTEVIDQNTVAILNTEPHAAFIEHGVRGENVKIGAAMIRALSEWVLRKGIAVDEDEAVGIAWAIAKTMQMKGVFNHYEEGNGLRILQELDEMYIEDILKEEVSREMQKAVDTLKRA